MKNLTKFGLLLISFFVLALSSCSDDKITSPTASYKFSCVINGGTYSNQTITFEKTAIGIYDPTDGVSGAAFTNAANENAVVAWKGTSKGTYQINEDNNVAIVMNNNKTVIGLTSGTITVSTYGAVGGEFSGSFSGTGMVGTENGIPASITITNGTFKAIRAN